MKFLNIFLLVFLITQFVFPQSNVIDNNGVYYFSDRIVVKFKQKSNSLNKNTQNLFSKLGITENQPAYGWLKNENVTAEEIGRIHTLKFSTPFNPVYISKELLKMRDIEWAEPHYLYELAYEPNDPFFADSTSNNFELLNLINAQEAWNTNKGSEEIIIAIIDTGVDWDHEDLADNIWINSDEIEGNGIDDDGNGFIDDIRGWDFGGLEGTPDNDPDEDRADHGTHVAGLASAVTDNNKGIASIGFNSKIMPVKTSQDDIRSGSTALIAYGFEGILYAADNGAKVINCSWGGYSYSFAAQEIINYAISKGAIVVGAAGNDNTANHFYPASYDGVLSVAGTNYVDQKATWSNYGTKVDVTSPGVSIYSTWLNDSYAFKQGTSMSSPTAAGLAALVTAQFPDYNPFQVGEQIRANTDNIENVNLRYINKLGSGRINASQALTNDNSKSVRISKVELIEVGDGDEIFESGENIKIKVEITNYLNPVSNLNLQLSDTDPNIELVKSSLTVGSLNMLDDWENESELLEIKVREDADENVDIDILVSFSGSDYSDQDWISLSINPTYQIQTTENISITFNSSGSIGFDDYPTNLKGKGLSYKDGPNLMFEGALVYGNSASRIVNAARDGNGDKDLDFSPIVAISQTMPGDFADKETYTKFSDALASPSSLGIETEVSTYSFSGMEDADYILINYSFKNTTSDRINDFYAGQYWDFDMDGGSFEDDMVAFDIENNFGYAFDDDGNPVTTHIGLALLSDENTNFFAMDNTGESNPTISWDGFSDSEKWTALTSGKTYLTSGPNDISLLISGGPYSIDPGSKLNVDFVVAAADDLTVLKGVIDKARNKYSELPTDIATDNNGFTDFRLEQNYPNPFNAATKIKYSIPFDKSSAQNVKLVVYDILGRELATLVDRKQNPGNYEIVWDAGNYSSGIYFYTLSAGSFVETKKMILLR